MIFERTIIYSLYNNSPYSICFMIVVKIRKDSIRRSRGSGRAIGSESASTQYLRSLFHKTHTLDGFWTRVLQYWVLGHWDSQEF